MEWSNNSRVDSVFERSESEILLARGAQLIRLTRPDANVPWQPSTPSEMTDFTAVLVWQSHSPVSSLRQTFSPLFFFLRAPPTPQVNVPERGEGQETFGAPRSRGDSLGKQSTVNKSYIPADGNCRAPRPHPHVFLKINKNKVTYSLSFGLWKWKAFFFFFKKHSKLDE